MTSTPSRGESSAQGAARESRSRRSRMPFTNRLASRSTLRSLDPADIPSSSPTPRPGPADIPCSSPPSRAGPAPSPSPSNVEGLGCSDFERNGKQYIYQERYHFQWIEWWETTAGYDKFLEKYKGKKLIWNSNLRGSSAWNSFVQCAQASETPKTPEGWPGIQCLVCELVISHPGSCGNKAMNDHITSRKCKQLRKKAGQKGSLTIAQLFANGTKVYPHTYAAIHTPLYIRRYTCAAIRLRGNFADILTIGDLQTEAKGCPRPRDLRSGRIRRRIPSGSAGRKPGLQRGQ